jgi:S-(hydroxymethyl)glutathione dehydrogenase/alcohol dehydrogenase
VNNNKGAEHDCIGIDRHGGVHRVDHLGGGKAEPATSTSYCGDTCCGGRGADYAFECTAIPELGAAPLAMVRNAGMAVQVSGIEQEIKIDMNLFEWDKIYINPLYGKTRPQIDFPILQDLYAKGDLLLDEMITRTYTLEDLELAFKDMHEGKNAKGVIRFDD